MKDQSDYLKEFNELKAAGDAKRKRWDGGQAIAFSVFKALAAFFTLFLIGLGASCILDFFGLV